MNNRLEERYLVIKLDRLDLTDTIALRAFLESNDLDYAKVDCVVIEEDWPEYDRVVNLLFKRIDNDVQQTIDD